jgi:hypothetical protein
MSNVDISVTAACFRAVAYLAKLKQLYSETSEVLGHR